MPSKAVSSLRSLHNILIVGGGAGGLELATRLGKTLGKKGLARPLLLDESPTHIWKPLLHEVATGTLNTGEDEVNYFSHGYSSGYEFHFGRMNGLDLKRKVVNIAPVTVNKTLVSGPRELSYDTLVLAVGGTSDTFGIPGVKENCLELNSPKEAEELRKTILGTALAVAIGSVPTLRIGIVGGGATGVELAAEIHHTISELKTFGILKHHLEVTIIERAPTILAGGHGSLAKYATKQLIQRGIEVRTNVVIKNVNSKGFEFADGTKLDKEIRIWTAGVKAPSWLAGIGLKVNNLNKIVVDGYLQSVDDPCVFAMGDCACVPWPPENPKAPGLPATAQVAHQQSEWLRDFIEAKLEGGTVEPFEYKPAGILVSLGASKAVGRLTAVAGPKKDYHVQGRGAKALYSSLYRQHQAVLYGWRRAGILWVGDKLRHVAVPQLKLH